MYQTMSRLPSGILRLFRHLINKNLFVRFFFRLFCIDVIEYFVHGLAGNSNNGSNCRGTIGLPNEESCAIID